MVLEIGSVEVSEDIDGMNQSNSAQRKGRYDKLNDKGVDDIFRASLALLNREDRDVISGMADELAGSVRRLGPLGAMEIVGKVAVLIVEHEKRHARDPRFRVVGKAAGLTMVKVVDG